MGSWNRSRTLARNYRNQNSVWTLIITHPYQVLSCNKCMILIGDVNREIGCEGHGNSVPSSQLFYKSKTILKNKVYFKKS